MSSNNFMLQFSIGVHAVSETELYWPPASRPDLNQTIHEKTGRTRRESKNPILWVVKRSTKHTGGHDDATLRCYRAIHLL